MLGSGWGWGVVYLLLHCSFHYFHLNYLHAPNYWWVGLGLLYANPQFFLLCTLSVPLTLRGCELHFTITYRIIRKEMWKYRQSTLQKAKNYSPYLTNSMRPMVFIPVYTSVSLSPVRWLSRSLIVIPDRSPVILKSPPNMSDSLVFQSKLKSRLNSTQV